MAERLTDLVAELGDEAFERLYGPLARLRLHPGHDWLEVIV